MAIALTSRELQSSFTKDVRLAEDTQGSILQCKIHTGVYENIGDVEYIPLNINRVWFHFGWLCSYHHMIMSSNENIFRVTGLCEGNSPVTGEFPAQRPVTRSFDIFFDLCLNNGWPNNQSWSWWFEMPSHPLWHHCNESYSLHMVC